VLALLGLNVSRCSIEPGLFVGGSNIRIGEDCYLNQRAFLDNSAAITLGERVYFGPQVTVLTSTHELGAENQRAGDVSAAPVRIGAGSWIGARSTIMPGVTIGPGCVVAAGSVVTKDCEPNSLYAGVPAVLKRPLDLSPRTRSKSAPPSRSA
jgi:maltose O-acetyltransferase